MIHLAVRQKIGAAGYLFLYSQENGLHNILDVDKRQILTAEAYGEVRVLPDGLCHQEIILLARTVNTRRAIDDVRETRYALQINLRFQFAKTVSRIGHRGVFSRYRSICLFAYRTEYAQGADKDKLPGNHVQFTQRIYKVFGLQIVHTLEVILVHAFGGSGAMDNIIELAVSPFMTGKLCAQFVGMRKVELKKMYLLILQILPAAGRTNACPYTESPPQRFFHDETSDKPACSCY